MIITLNSLSSRLLIFVLLCSRSVVSDSLPPHGLWQPGFSVFHHLLEFAQADVRLVGDDFV